MCVPLESAQKIVVNTVQKEWSTTRPVRSLSAGMCQAFPRNYTSNRTEATLATWTAYLPGFLMFAKAKSPPPFVVTHKMAPLGFLL